MPFEALGVDTDQADALATECAEVAALVGWNVHQAGLADLRQVVPCRVPDKGDVVLATEHFDELLQQTFLLRTPGRTVLKRLDQDTGVISKWVREL